MCRLIFITLFLLSLTRSYSAEYTSVYLEFENHTSGSIILNQTTEALIIPSGESFQGQIDVNTSGILVWVDQFAVGEEIPYSVIDGQKLIVRAYQTEVSSYFVIENKYDPPPLVKMENDTDFFWWGFAVAIPLIVFDVMLGSVARIPQGTVTLSD